MQKNVRVTLEYSSDWSMKQYSSETTNSRHVALERNVILERNRWNDDMQRIQSDYRNVLAVKTTHIPG